METETRIAVGEALKAGKRDLYPVLKVIVLYSEKEIQGLWILPLALLVVEPQEDYLISLRGEEAVSEELAELASSLKALAKEARKKGQFTYRA